MQKIAQYFLLGVICIQKQLLLYCCTFQELTDKKYQSYKKSTSSMELIRQAIMDNDFMKKLEEGQIKVLFVYLLISKFLKKVILIL